MIINPMFFYLIQVCASVRIAMFIITAGLVAAMLFVFCIALESNVFPIVNEDDEKEWAKAKKNINWLVTAALLTLAIGLLIPNKETILLMQAAKLTTTDNVNAVFEALKAAIDYAVTILE